MATKLNVIDVSQHNGAIDWTKVKGKVDAAIIRAGYRGYGKAGTLATDTRFRENAKAANKANIPIGVYWLSQALSEAEAKAEATYLVKLLKDFKITYPVYLDSEHCEINGNGRADKLDKATRTKYAKVLLAAIKAAGYTAGLYCSEDWFKNEIDGSAIRSLGYTVWCARLAGEPRIGAHDAWQYSWKGKINGITGDVDLSYFYKDFSANDKVTEYGEAVKNRFGLSDGTIKYLREYKYGEDLLRKLATKG